MTTTSFTQAARQPIIDSEPDEALAVLGDEASPEKDVARFELYMAAIDRAKISNNGYPDLPSAVAQACERVIDQLRYGTESYRGVQIPTHVNLAYCRFQVEKANQRGDRRTAFSFLAAHEDIRSLSLG